MNRDDVTRMAREAGLHIATDVNWMPIIGLEYAERFAALVRKDYSTTHANLWLDRIHKAMLEEREACAGLRKEVALQGKHTTEYEEGFWDGLEKYEDLIRARGLT
jgi:hypothetical protein